MRLLGGHLSTWGKQWCVSRSGCLVVRLLGLTCGWENFRGCVVVVLRADIIILHLGVFKVISHTLLVTITLVFHFLRGLIHYEADVTVWKRSVVGVMHSTECSSQGVGVAEVPPTERVDEFYIISQCPAPADTMNKMLSSHYYGNYGFLKST